MPSANYRGDTTCLVRDWKTRTGVLLGQDEETGDCYAICQKCFHQILPISNTWTCSAPVGCGLTYGSVPLMRASRYSAHRIIGPDGGMSFINWIEQWTGLKYNELEFTVEVDHH